MKKKLGLSSVLDEIILIYLNVVAPNKYAKNYYQNTVDSL